MICKKVVSSELCDVVDVFDHVSCVSRETHDRAETKENMFPCKMIHVTAPNGFVSGLNVDRNTTT